jgi:hypothetical protein
VKLLALLLLVALPALAEEEPLQIPGLQCTSYGICVIPLAAVNVMIELHNQHIQEIRDLKAKKPPKCAEVEVTEPSKNAPPQTATDQTRKR